MSCLLYVTKSNTVKYFGYLPLISQDTGFGTLIPGLTGVDRVYYTGINYGTIYFLMLDGTVKAIGNNFQGQLGVGDKINRKSIIDIPITNVKSISIGNCCVFFLLKDGTVKVCGERLKSFMPESLQKSNFLYPVELPLKDVKSIHSNTVSEYNAMFMLNNGDIYCVGFNQYGELGFADTQYKQLVKLENNGLEKDIKDIQLYNDVTWILYNDGTLRTCGKQVYIPAYGILNNSKVIATNIKQMYCSSLQRFFVTYDDVLFCNGYQDYNCLGNGDKSIYGVTKFEYQYSKKIVNIVLDNHSYLVFEDGDVVGFGSSEQYCMFGRPPLYKEQSMDTYGYINVHGNIADLKYLMNTDRVEFDKFLISNNRKDLIYPNINTNTLDSITTSDIYNFDKDNISNGTLNNMYKNYLKINRTSITPFRIYMSRKIY